MHKASWVFVGLALIGGWIAWPFAWQSFRNGTPLDIGLDDYLAQGSDREWLQLHRVYIDGTHRVGTVMTQNGREVGGSYTYFPLRTGPDDARPVRLFLRANHFADLGSTIQLIGSDDASPPTAASPEPLLQDVPGTLSVGLDAGADVRAALRRGALPAVEEVRVLVQGATPVSLAAAVALAVAPIALLALGVLGIRRKPGPDATTAPRVVEGQGEPGRS